MTTFNQTVDAGCSTATSVAKSAGKMVSVSSTGSVSVQKTISSTHAETVVFPWVEGALRPAWNLTLSGATSFNFSAGGASYTWIAGAEVAEALGIDGSLGVNQVLKDILAQQFGISELIYTGRPVSLGESVNVAQSLTTVLGALIAERLSLVETNAPSLTYKQTLLEYLSIFDGLGKFLSGALTESLNVAPVITPVGVGIRSASDTVNIEQVISPKLIAVATVPDSLVLDDANVLQAIFKPIINEAFAFDMGLALPGGGFTTWTVNTRTGATTEYQNYAFNSFAQSGHRYLGASSTGLYVLDGDDDDGTPTVATLRSGYAQFGGSRYSSIKAAYLGIHGSGDVYLKIEDSTGDSTTYQVKLQDYQTTKCRVGKGLRARYFAWELVTTGQDFDMDSLEFVPLVAQRRV